jgi:hypothetical protein
MRHSDFSDRRKNVVSITALTYNNCKLVFRFSRRLAVPCSLARWWEKQQPAQTLVHFYTTIRNRFLEDGHLYTRRCKSLKSYIFNHGSLLHGRPGARAPTEKLNGMLNNPWSIPAFSLVFKPFPHNYFQLIHIHTHTHRHRFWRRNFVLSFYFCNTHPTLHLNRQYGRLSCMCPVSFWIKMYFKFKGDRGEWTHCSSSSFVVGYILNSLELSAGWICNTNPSPPPPRLKFWECEAYVYNKTYQLFSKDIIVSFHSVLLKTGNLHNPI